MFGGALPVWVAQCHCGQLLGTGVAGGSVTPRRPPRAGLAWSAGPGFVDGDDLGPPGAVAVVLSPVVQPGADGLDRLALAFDGDTVERCEAEQRERTTDAVRQGQV